MSSGSKVELLEFDGCDKEMGCSVDMWKSCLLVVFWTGAPVMVVKFGGSGFKVGSKARSSNVWSLERKNDDALVGSAGSNASDMCNNFVSGDEVDGAAMTSDLFRSSGNRSEGEPGESVDVGRSDRKWV